MSGFEALLAGRTLCDRYLIEALIGRGGMGAVYRAADQRLGREVAVKVISPAGGVVDPAARESLRGRFVREARAAARLHHPNVVTIHDFGTDPGLGLDFLVMELLRGEDLAQRLGRGWTPSPAEAVAVLRGAARGLAAGHRAGLVHRDVKPGNLFLCDDEEEGGDGGVRVLDFGIAQVTLDDGTVTHFTRWGGAPLSPAYAAPEQLRGESVLGPACDVYGLGAIAYQFLAGRRPFTDAQVRRIADGLPADPPAAVEPGPGLPAELSALVSRTLAFAPADRPSDAASFLDALDAALGIARPVSHRREPFAPIVPPPVVLATADGEDEGDADGFVPGLEGEEDDGEHTMALASTGGRGGGGSAVATAGAGAATRAVTGPRRFCDRCGRRLEVDSRFCPGCGLAVPGAAATADPAARTGAPPARKRRSRTPLLAALVAVLVAAAGAGAAALSGTLPLPLASRGAEAEAPRPIETLPEILVAVPERVREPEWSASYVGQDPFCGNFFDACIRVQCSVANTGDAPGTASVTAALRGDAEHERSASIHLRPGERQVLTFPFPEVHADERYDQAVCTAETESVGDRDEPEREARGPGPAALEDADVTDTISME